MPDATARQPAPAMPLSHRTERIAEQIREELSQMLATEISDPGIGLVTVTRVRVTPDLSLARVYWTIMGGPTERAQTTKALRRAAPYVRHLLAGRMTLRRVPEVQFVFDQGVAAQDRVEQLIQQIHAEDAERQASVPPAGDEPPAADEPAGGEAAAEPDDER